MNTADRNRRIEALFDEALDLPPETWPAFLDRQCAEDALLRREVESLLQRVNLARTEDLLAPLECVGDEPEIARQIGPYRVIERIGEGGMGSIYLAERTDGQYEKRVAIKLVRRGMDTEEVLRRFVHERQVLASLEHPNVAYLLDGGVTGDGRPYFVMEYIAGEPITTYCERRELSLSARLDLFRQVCAAVQYAHQNLVVHRDLKPSNILVTETGQVKLLDFGIAKLLSPGRYGPSMPETRMDQPLMTPEYAAPEQVLGTGITTAADVYALGVVLYELLAGHRPFQFKNHSRTEIERVLLQEDPPPPSVMVLQRATQDSVTGPPVALRLRHKPARARARQLQGDLDNIVLKALRKEPERRYGSPAQLSDDLRRHVANLPVLARPDTLRYRGTRFVRRNRSAVAGTLLLVLVLAGGVVATLWQARVARQQRDLALHTAQAMIGSLSEGLAALPGPVSHRTALLNQATRVFDEISRAGMLPPRAERQHVDALRKLANAYKNLGDLPLAERYAREAVDRGRQLETAGEADPHALLFLAQALMALGQVQQNAGETAAAESSYAEATLHLNALLHQADLYPQVHRWLVHALIPFGDLIWYSQGIDSAAVVYRRACLLSDTLQHAPRLQTDYYWAKGLSVYRLADVHFYSGRADESRPLYRQAATLHRRAAELAPNDPHVLVPFTVSLAAAAWAAEVEGNRPETLRLYEEGVGTLRRLHYADPSNVFVAAKYAGMLAEYGDARDRAGDHAGGLATLEAAYEVGERFFDGGIVAADLYHVTANTGTLLAARYASQHDYTHALRLMGHACALYDTLVTRDTTNLEDAARLAEILTAEGDLLKQGRNDDAGQIERYEAALALRHRIARRSDKLTDWERFASTHYDLALLYRSRGQPDHARALLQAGRTFLLDLQAAGRLDTASAAASLLLPRFERALQ